MTIKSFLISLHEWIDGDVVDVNQQPGSIQWVQLALFVLWHLICFSVIWVGWSVFAALTAFFLYFIRMFAITGFYHRYFAHKTFKTSRFWQFIFAVIATSAGQRGPLWWASHHRKHHRFTETSNDPHSPSQHGILWSHLGWIFSRDNSLTDYSSIKDFAKYPELRWLNRYDKLVPILLILSLFVLGAICHNYYPQLHTNGVQLVVWGYFISTVCLYHATFAINSIAHIWGNRPFQTEDDSRNNAFLAIITLGEGWHNNHHYYPRSASQGFRWWQIDITYNILWCLEKLNIIHDLNRVPLHLRQGTELIKPVDSTNLLPKIEIKPLNQ